MYIVGPEVLHLPTILRVRNLRFFFFLNEHDPPHVHVTIGTGVEYPHAKVLLETFEVKSVRGFSRSDMAKILEVVETFQEPLLDAWEAYFGEED